ncbi:hypothetical protein ACJD0Z_11355 [Flavobacteriaceae bacterium M23B6Z8]
MIKIIFRLTLPLTLISFGIISKWWFGIAEDAKDVFLYGFPLIHKCEGFHTSLSTQYFMAEMTINFLTYFVFWLILTVVFYRFWKIKISKRISKIFWIGFGIMFLAFIYLSSAFDDRYLLRRNFEVKIIDCGFTIFESHSNEREKYNPSIEKTKYKLK